MKFTFKVVDYLPPYIKTDAMEYVKKLFNDSKTFEELYDLLIYADHKDNIIEIGNIKLYINKALMYIMNNDSSILPNSIITPKSPVNEILHFKELFKEYAIITSMMLYEYTLNRNGTYGSMIRRDKLSSELIQLIDGIDGEEGKVRNIIYNRTTLNASIEITRVNKSSIEIECEDISREDVEILSIITRTKVIDKISKRIPEDEYYVWKECNRNSSWNKVYEAIEEAIINDSKFQ